MTSLEDFLAFRFRLHVVANWARKIVFAPKLVQAVKEVRWHHSSGNDKDSCISIDKRYLLKVLDTKDLLCWDCDVNIKPPASQVSTHFLCPSSYPDDFFFFGHIQMTDLISFQAFYSWHQDSTYSGWLIKNTIGDGGSTVDTVRHWSTLLTWRIMSNHFIHICLVPIFQ